MAKAPTEKHLENWIVDNFHWFGDLYDNDYLYGFENVAVKFNEDQFVVPLGHRIVGRQFQLPDGIADLIITDDNRLMVVELKKGPVTFDALGQCLRYMNNLQSIFYAVRADTRNPDNPDRLKYEYTRPQYEEVGQGWAYGDIVGVLVGNSIADPNILVAASVCGIEVFTYDMHKNGACTFERQFPESKCTVERCDEYLDAPLGIAMRHLMRCNHDRMVARSENKK